MQRFFEYGRQTKVTSRVRDLTHALRDILYGMSVYEWTREIEKERGSVERLFVLVTFGDMLGVPILPPYYTLRLLPFAVPHLRTWRYSMLRERDMTDMFDQEIG
jgi:hypothetical protein